MALKMTGFSITTVALILILLVMCKSSPITRRNIANHCTDSYQTLKDVVIKRNSMATIARALNAIDKKVRFCNFLFQYQKIYFQILDIIQQPN